MPGADVLQRLFLAAAWAPSRGNGQPWRFVVGLAGDATWPVVLGCLSESNRFWAHRAPVLGIGIAQTLRNDRPLLTGPYDLGQAMGHLTVQATTDGLQVHQMAGFDADAARAAFAIPDGFASIAAFAIGPPGAVGDLPAEEQPEEERRLALPRERRALAETVFAGRYGEPAAWAVG